MAMGRIHSWESMGLVDGPGIRTVIFYRAAACGAGIAIIRIRGSSVEGGPWNLRRRLVNRLMRFKPYYGADGGSYVFRRGAAVTEGISDRGPCPV